MTTIEPRGADSLPQAQGDPGQARSQGAPGIAGGPQPVDPQPANPQPAGPQPVDPQPANPQPTGPESAHPRSVGPEWANPESAGPELTHPELTHPELAGPKSAGLESAGLGLDAGELPPRSRGVIGLLEENCTVCMLCARECPDWCIYIESHKQTVPAPEGGRPRVRNVLDRFAIDFSLCMYCGICIEVCPYDALFWSPEFGYPETGIGALTHERDRLRDWMWTVPPPPAHDPGAPLPREAQAAGPGAGPAVEPG
jgi:NADH-quinone oxidoreductase subunit I